MGLTRREFLVGVSAGATVSPAVTFGDKGADSAAECFRVKPHLQLLDENSVAVVWMTGEKATGYVTWTQDNWNTTHTAWREKDGLLDANSYMHKAVINGFDPHRRLDFRVHSRIFGNFGPYTVSYAGDEAIDSGTMNAILPGDGSISWAMFNDVHENLGIYDSLIGHLDGITSFCVFNGDIINHVDDEADVEQRLLAPLARVSQTSKLPVWYLRGNHETRGGFARNLRDYLALKDNRYYGAVTIGGVRFAFLDTGEDKQDGHREYSGLVAFDRYLEEQNAWLKRETMSAEWRNSHARIVVRHIPGPLTVPVGDWRHNLPRLYNMDMILKQANVTLCMGAHLHHWDWHDPITARPYPMIVGGGPGLGNPQGHDNATLVKCRLCGKTLSAQLLDQTGRLLIDKTLAV